MASTVRIKIYEQNSLIPSDVSSFDTGQRRGQFEREPSIDFSSLNQKITMNLLLSFSLIAIIHSRLDIILILYESTTSYNSNNIFLFV